jgi:hypothetical protein
VIKHLKGKLSATISELPDLAAKKCIKFIKKPLTDIYNASLESDIFPDRSETATVKPPSKNKIKKIFKIIDPYLSYQLFKKFEKS